MNFILFEPGEVSGTPGAGTAEATLPREDPRAVHLLRVLARKPGDTFDAGLVNGPRGRGTLVRAGPRMLELALAWGEPLAPADPLVLVIGLPRPQTARDILREATTLGATALHFVCCGKAEAGYARSTLWSGGEWRRHVLAGAAQAFDPRIPTVEAGAALGDTLGRLAAGGARVALDNYEAAGALAKVAFRRGEPVTLAFGPERGWSAEDRTRLREAGFRLAHLGARVLRLETAVVAAVTLVQAARGDGE